MASKVYEFTLTYAQWDAVYNKALRYSFTAEYHFGTIIVRTYSRALARLIEGK